MPGLDPGIHRFRKKFFVGWIAGSSPAMTSGEIEVVGGKGGRQPPELHHGS